MRTETQRSVSEHKFWFLKRTATIDPTNGLIAPRSILLITARNRTRGYLVYHIWFGVPNVHRNSQQSHESKLKSHRKKRGLVITVTSNQRSVSTYGNPSTWYVSILSFQMVFMVRKEHEESSRRRALVIASNQRSATTGTYRNWVSMTTDTHPGSPSFKTMPVHHRHHRQVPGPPGTFFGQ